MKRDIATHVMDRQPTALSHLEEYGEDALDIRNTLIEKMQQMTVQGSVALRVPAAPSQEDLLSALSIAAPTGSNGRSFVTIVAINQAAQHYRPEILRPTRVPIPNGTGLRHSANDWCLQRPIWSRIRGWSSSTAPGGRSFVRSWSWVRSPCGVRTSSKSPVAMRDRSRERSRCRTGASCQRGRE